MGSGRDRRRYRFEIWADVLRSIQELQRQPGPLRVSHVRSSANMPHNRFWELIEEMDETGLLDADDLEPTREGQRFLDDFADIEDILERYELA